MCTSYAIEAQMRFIGSPYVNLKYQENIVDSVFQVLIFLSTNFVFLFCFGSFAANKLLSIVGSSGWELDFKVWQFGDPSKWINGL